MNLNGPTVNFNIFIESAEWEAPWWGRLWSHYKAQFHGCQEQDQGSFQGADLDKRFLPNPSTWQLAYASQKIILISGSYPGDHQSEYSHSPSEISQCLFCDSNLMSARFDCSGVKAGDGAAVMAGLEVCLKSPTASAGPCSGRG